MVRYTRMKGESGKSAARFCSHVAIILAGIALLFPGSASVLCVGPGGHVAVEDINAACCARSAIDVADGSQPGSGFAAAGDCQNCTDVFLAQSTRGAIPESHCTVKPDSPADSYLQYHLPSATHLSSRRSAVITRIDAPVDAASSAPLRC